MVTKCNLFHISRYFISCRALRSYSGRVRQDIKPRDY